MCSARVPTVLVERVFGSRALRSVLDYSGLIQEGKMEPGEEEVTMIRKHFGKRIRIKNACLLFASLAFAISAAAQQPGTIGWWKLQETKGRLAYDSSGNFLTGSIIGNVDIGQPGVIGKAYFFNVNGLGWVQVPYDALLSPQTSHVTVTAWIKPTGENASGQMAVVSNEGIS